MDKEIRNRDIFISYRNDDSGNNFAARLYEDLTRLGYSVYFDPYELRNGELPKRLEESIETCTDFLLIVSEGCIAGLKGNKKENWVRREILCAKKNDKDIIPILFGKSFMPDKVELPDELKFLADRQGFYLPEQYMESPIKRLIPLLDSHPDTDSRYMNESNNSEWYNVSEDFESTREEAERGSYKAMYKIANMYYYGFWDEGGTTNREFEKAYYWFAKISACNNEYKAYADSMLGCMYYNGAVPDRIQSYKKALEYHENAAKNIDKFGYSATRVAFMKQYARGCEFDFEEIERYYRSFIERGDDIIKMNLGDFYANYGQYQKAANMYESMENRNAVAEYKLGMLYKKGVLSSPIKPDYVRAFYHFQNAINGEYPYADAANQIGLLYFAPTGQFKKDFKIAQHYFELAAGMGNSSAQYMLGYMHEFGYVQKDIKRAINYFTQAVEQGEINSAHHLAMLYQQEDCRDYYKAYKYAKISAGNSVPEGEFIYANLLYMGRGCRADASKAYEYYKRAREHGIEQAAFMIEEIEGKNNFFSSKSHI